MDSSQDYSQNDGNNVLAKTFAKDAIVDSGPEIPTALDAEEG